MGDKMAAALFLSACGAAGQKDFFRRAAGQLKLFEGNGGHGGNSLPGPDRPRGLVSGQAEPPIRKIMLELIGEDGQGQSPKVLPVRRGNEIQDVGVYLVLWGIHRKNSIGSRQNPVNERGIWGWSCA